MSEINIQLKTYEQLQHEIIQLNTDKYLLQQENQQLKKNNLSMQEEMARTWEKADLYKEVIEEVRKKIKEHRYITDKVTDEDSLYYGQEITLYAFNDDNVMELLQILDKVKGE